MIVERVFYHWSEDGGLTSLDTAARATSRHWQAKRFGALTIPTRPRELTWNAFTESALEYQNGPVKRLCEIAKEFIFEDVRRTAFPDLPSRRSCLYLLDEDLDPRACAVAMGLAMTHLYRVRVDEGRLHRGAIAHLNCNTKSYDMIEERAGAYWRGGERGAGTEVLFEGRCQLTRVQ